MKRRIPLFLILFLLLSFFELHAQTAVSPYQKKWLFGMNWGGAWENADVHSRLGTGWGLTLEKEIIANNTSLLGFSLRGRYLHTWMWGRDLNRFYGIDNDENLNGTVNPSIDYTSQGYAFRNFYAKTNEFSLEGLLILNRLRAHSGFKIYGFGGIAATGYTTKINQLDGTNSAYDYTNVSTTSKSLTRMDLNDLWDKTYETNSVAGRTRSSYVLAGAIGIGIGIKLSPNVYLGWEHKYTYTSTDMLDGSRWNNDNTPSLKNDRYHYSNLFVTVALGAGSASSQTNQTPNQTTYQPTPTGVYKPEIILKSPNQNPVTFSDCFAEIKLAVSNVTSVNQITVLVDGNSLNGSAYNYDNYSGILTIRTQLAGNTTFTIIAENQSGKDTKYVYANCPAPVPLPVARPEISIVNAVGNNCVANVVASIKNVTDVRTIQVLMDGRTLASNQYSFDSYNGVLSLAVPFTSTTNITIRVNNNGYIVENSVSVSCTPSVPVIVPVQTPPFIDVTNSQVVKSTGDQCVAKITATITGIASVNDIIVTCNGTLLNANTYTYNPSYGILTINYPIVGTNTFLIKARNAGGEVNSTVNLTCVNQPIALPPSIVLVYPATKSIVSTTCQEHIVVKIPNITAVENIDVRINGTSINKGLISFNPTTSVVSFDATIVNQTQVVITASNTSGVATETFVITCKPLDPPTIQVSFPATEPFVSTSCKEIVTATLTGVTNSAAIQITQNGLPVTAGVTFDAATKKLTVPVTFTDRSTLVINAVGAGGAVSKTITLICQPIPKPIITIISPTANPIVSALCAESITAQIQNAATINDISVKLNDIEIEKSKLVFNTATGLLVVPVTFTGVSNLVIQATNSSGTISQSVSLQCKPIVLPKPGIKVILPTTNNTISKTCHEPVQVQLTNCSSVSDISVLINGASMSSDNWVFDANTGMLSFQVEIKTTTTVLVNAKNNGGLSTVTLTFQCKPTAKPSVSILQPIGTPYVSTSCSENFVLAIANVANVNQIDATYNAVAIDKSLFNYDTLTRKLTFLYSFTGNGNLVVKAKNEAGEDSKTIQLQCKPILKPELTIVSPAANPYKSEICNDTIIAVVKNITSIAGIKVYSNDVEVPSVNVTFDNVSGNIRIITAYSGDKEIKIVATNEAGTITQTKHLTCSPILQPTISLVNPVSENYSSTTCQENVLMTLTNITSIDQISVKINSVQVEKSKYTFNTATGLLTIPTSITTQAIVEVTATNKSKVATKTCTIVCNKLPLPTITATAPSSAVLDNCTALASAVLTNISSKEQLVITVNGVALTSSEFTFENNTLSFPITVKTKSEIIVTATNTTGSTTFKRTLVCNVSQVVTGPTGTSCENIQKTSITNCTTCNDTIKVATGTITVGANRKVCITSPFDGNVNLNGGQLVICSNAKIHNINFNSGDIVINGSASFDNLNMNSAASAIRNYGTVQFSNITFNGRFENHGQATVSSDFNINSGATFINTGTFNAKQSFNNNKYVCNSGTINVSGNLKDNGSAEFINSCKLIVGGDLHIDHTFQNSGAVKVAASTVLNGSGKLTLAGNSKWITSSLMINGSISGPSQNCASINITGQTTINSSATLAGKIDICDANGIESMAGTIAGTVTTNCSCSVTAAGNCVINDDLAMSITICHKPSGDPTQIQSLIIPKSAVPEHLAHGDHIGNCTDADKVVVTPPVVVPPVVVPPVEEEKVTICHKPPGNPTNVQTITVAKSALSAHLAHGDHVGGCIDSDLPKKEEPVVVPPVVVPPVEEEKVTICHKPPGNPTNVQTITVAKSALSAHLAHGDHVGGCIDSDLPKKEEPVVVPPVVLPPVEEEKVTICHKPPGNPTNVQTITVAKSALSAHLAHGDHVGGCTDSDLPKKEEPVVVPPVVVPPVAIPPAEDEKVTICHKPPGDPTNIQNITISKSALSAHLAHGDHVGECTDAEKSNIKEEQLKQQQLQEQQRQHQEEQQKQQQEAEKLKQQQLLEQQKQQQLLEQQKQEELLKQKQLQEQQKQQQLLDAQKKQQDEQLKQQQLLEQQKQQQLLEQQKQQQAEQEKQQQLLDQQKQQQVLEQQKQQQLLEKEKLDQEEKAKQQQVLEQQKQQQLLEQQKQQHLLDEQKRQQDEQLKQQQEAEKLKQQQLLEQQKQQEAEQLKQQQLLEQQKQQQLEQQKQQEAERLKQQQLLEQQKQQQLLEQQKQQEAEKLKQQQLLEQQKQQEAEKLKQQQLLEQQKQQEAERLKQQQLLEQQKQQQLLEQQKQQEAEKLKQQQLLEQQKQQEAEKLKQQQLLEQQKKQQEAEKLKQQQEQLTTICHKENGSAQTIRVPASKLNEHLGHGDHVGVCTPEEGQ